MKGRRADAVVAARGLARSRTSAAAAIRAGRVRLGRHGRVVQKPGELIDPAAELSVAEGQRFVSRGGHKLDHALERLGLDVADRLCLDVGASTGGFTDCLLQRGARQVIALDVARGQLDWALRNDARVHVIERTNARRLTPGDLPFVPDLIAADVAFISLRKLLPALAGVLGPGGDMLLMVKPQFEVGRERVGKGGVVRDAAERRAAVREVAGAAAAAGLVVRGVASSGLPGPKGNRETFLWCADGGATLADLEAALAEAEL